MTPASVPKQLYRLNEAAAILGVHRQTLKAWHLAGRITLTRVGPRLWHMSRKEIARVLRVIRDE